MSTTARNPYLPLYEYVPDGEPRVFDGRLYVYGSHDRARGDFFCLDDYVVWSAPLEDPGDWRYEGVSYRKGQDPTDPEGRFELFAPDVVRGKDGRYYLYYCLRMQQEFGVAVSDSPAGPFEFYAHVNYPDGTLCREYMPYDPAVLVDDDGRVYLYYGYTSETIAASFGATVSRGCMTLELASDMHTILKGPLVCLPRDINTAGTGFEGHGYYEAPSIRKIRGRYYLVYSSEVCHELCYAISDRPMEGYTYGGVIVSNGEIGYRGKEYPICLIGNNHGGLVEVEGQYYIFYQRHTNCTQYSRQGCAEPVKILPDGSIPQVELTSSGLNNGPLPAKGTWSAAYACHLTHAKETRMLHYRELKPEMIPYITEETDKGDPAKSVQYISNISDGTAFGYKYFLAENVTSVTIRVRGKAKGAFRVRLDDPKSGRELALLPVDLDDSSWTEVSAGVHWSGINALYLVYEGSGSPDVKDIILA